MSTEEATELANEAVPRIDFKHAIPRHLTHKRRVENVYVTSIDRVSEQVFLCGAFVPQANVYLNGMRANANDVALTIIEIGRQMGIAICHTYMGVTHDTVFVLNTMHFEILPAYHSVDWTVEDTVSAKMVLSKHAYRPDGSLSSVCAAVEFFIGDKVIFALCCDWSIQPVQSGRRLREIARVKNMRSAQATGEQVKTLDGFRIQRTLKLNRPVLSDALWVVGSDGFSFATTLQVDLSNQFFFDHENDHVPGMLIMEGMRELSLDVAMRFPKWSTNPPHIVRADLAYKNYAELEYPVVVVADVEDRVDAAGNEELHIRVDARQFGRTISDGVIVIR